MLLLDRTLSKQPRNNLESIGLIVQITLLSGGWAWWVFFLSSNWARNTISLIQKKWRVDASGLCILANIWFTPCISMVISTWWLVPHTPEADRSLHLSPFFLYFCPRCDASVCLTLGLQFFFLFFFLMFFERHLPSSLPGWN